MGSGLRRRLTAFLRRCVASRFVDGTLVGDHLPISEGCGIWIRRMPEVRVRVLGLVKSSRRLPYHERCTRIDKRRETIRPGVSVVIQLGSVGASHRQSAAFQVWVAVVGTL